jgi:hypothetical protein
MPDLDRREMAQLNNTKALLVADAERAGRTLADELIERTDVELAALYVGFLTADQMGHRGEQRIATAREMAHKALSGEQGVVGPLAAANFRIVLTQWIGAAATQRNP